MIDRTKLTPEQLKMLDAMTELTNAISKAADNAPLHVFLGALMNNMGRAIQHAAEAGQQSNLLMQTAVGLQTLAETAATASGLLEEPESAQMPVSSTVKH